ncbi:unnamed protein product [Mytilus edulis]|uniref:Mab-21-like HhH/H2TH-like domain-containing protein n=1 Tax=Mytilus edulis TaxID=6550 RepID=A0A8S3UR44_MYTED|nr:unnamed protein product [Mytilus edulis]
MERAANKVKEIKPVLDYVHQKVVDYRKQRPYDTVTVVGSVGNELYFPEVMPDGSYLVEVDVLYNREMPNAALPIYSDRDEASVLYNREEPNFVVPTEKQPFITVQMDFMDDKNRQIELPMGACLVEVTSDIDEVDAGQRWKFFKKLWNGKTYLKSLGYTCLIPRQEDPSILGEIEIEPLETIRMLPLYRTCRTNTETMIVGGRELKFKILVDKVSALKGPWPHKLSDFQNRERKWPETKVVDTIVQDGCLLTHKTSMLVYPLQWKITFALAEQQLTTRFSFHQKFLFILLKLVKKKYLDMGVMENGDARVGLTSYHLKTIYLWACETRDPQQFAEYPGMAFLAFLSSLRKCIENFVCPHYFIPTLNVMEGIGQYKKQLTENDKKWIKEHKSIQSTLLKKIDNIIRNPEEFLTEDLLEVVDEKHLHELEKTIGEVE